MLRGGRQSTTAAAGILGQDDNGGEGGRILRESLQGREERDPVTDHCIHHHIKNGG